MQRLGRTTFARDPEVVARALLGTLLVVGDGPTRRVARVVETEAYGGPDDPASHAFRGPTPRCAVMFGPAGVLYVYKSYGLHWCANVVTGPAGVASAVLVRAAELLAPEPGLLRGPGLVTRALGVTGADSGLDCCARDARVFFARDAVGLADADVEATPRVGVSREVERPWRFVVGGHPAASRRPRPPMLKAT
ncbi:MAG TPA: DNA-3-methyladenine glycosylase [Acidimicrobiales bacterium]|nr:MAG: 3-methyladenine DNA glycosylase [Actinobacteria bacterium 21-73-9]HQU25969.1 DNA-3-methyladenine glycosylase [Acidimicrobiales bacterium]